MKTSQVIAHNLVKKGLLLTATTALSLAAVTTFTHAPAHAFCIELPGLRLGCDGGTTPITPPSVPKYSVAQKNPHTRSVVQRFGPVDKLKVNDLIEVALETVRSQGGGFGRRREIIAENETLENPQRSVVTITEEGFADDSVRGHRYTLQLQKDADGNWVVADLQKSWVCQSGRGSQVYAQELCH
ncbi:hypothetical protein C1752_01843 [Acaryochloris thomasi RCC1774]|uniref:ARC6 IMS domain-containing protein n=1 Tax=Acaryochloris thomasi RCC1774 TaxID=1764569 RepID=A0A2W1JTQ1_9CYAN|nr:hypothetical protein [Acaryochloris thomasi]PZD73942.1 hypothetical protein C1752_01843 [Acaryochloris thomasi RCC1774]